MKQNVSSVWWHRAWPPMLSQVAIFLVLGLLGTLLLPQAWPLALLLALLCATMRGYGAAVGMLAGMLLAWHTHASYHALPSALIKQDLQVKGRVIEVLKRDRVREAVLFEVEDYPQLGTQSTPLPSRIRLSWYHSAHRLKRGSRWQFTVRMRAPSGLHHSLEPNYATYLFANGIEASGYVRDKEPIQRLQPQTSWVEAFRNHYAAWMRQRLGHYDSHAYLLALAIGDRSALTPSHWHWLRETGLSHLMAISGLHISMAAGVGYVLLLVLWRLSARLCLWQPAHRPATMAAVAGAGFYFLISGMGLPAQRAMIMLTVFFVGLWVSRRFRISDRFSLAVIGVLMFSPASILSAGFWLSFTAVAALLAGLYTRQRKATQRQRKWYHWLSDLAYCQWLLSLALTAVSLFFFQSYSWLAPLLNLILIPLFSLLVIPVLLFGTIAYLLGYETLTLALLKFFAQGFDMLSAWISEALIHPHWSSFQSSPVVLICWLVLGWLLVLCPKTALRPLWLLLVIPIVWPKAPQPNYGDFHLYALDVGQGLATVIVTEHHTLLYDVGSRHDRSGFDAGLQVVVPFLKGRLNRAPDGVIISHGDGDHMGGFGSVHRYFPHAQVWTSEPERLPETPLKLAACTKHGSWSWDGVQFSLFRMKQARGNDASCVLKVVSDRGYAALLPGDLTWRGERWLVQDLAQVLPSDLLVAPHHGSISSSSGAFLDAVQPKVAWISSGAYNRYGHPHAEVVARYTMKGIALYGTAECGTLMVSSAKPAQVKTRLRHCQTLTQSDHSVEPQTQMADFP